MQKEKKGGKEEKARHDQCPFNNTEVPTSGGCQNNRPNAVLDGGHTSAAIATAKVQQNTASIRLISSPCIIQI